MIQHVWLWYHLLSSPLSTQKIKSYVKSYKENMSIIWENVDKTESIFDLEEVWFF